MMNDESLGINCELRSFYLLNSGMFSIHSDELLFIANCGVGKKSLAFELIAESSIIIDLWQSR